MNNKKIIKNIRNSENNFEGTKFGYKRVMNSSETYGMPNNPNLINHQNY
jgi:hypothetical protein